MAVEQLTESQVREWTAEQKDRWWLENVFRGDMPQLTIRSALTGMILGGVLSLTNLYIGIQTGWTLGVGITSVILAFAAFKTLSRHPVITDLYDEEEDWRPAHIELADRATLVERTADATRRHVGAYTGGAVEWRGRSPSDSHTARALA